MTLIDERPATVRWRPEPTPAVATPTLLLFFGALAVWGVGLWATLSGHLPTPAVIALDAVVTFVMFTVVHDATHHSVGTSTRLNAVFGRLSMLFFAGYAGFGLFRWIHIEHHRNTNEDIGADPDAWAKAGPAVLLPLRWVTLDLRYLWLWARARRPIGERLESVVTLSALAAIIVATSLTGTFWWFLIIFLIPQRIGLVVLVWWFDWLPHHGLETTQRENRYQATRIRAGWEPLLTPVLLYQNYHLVHHLHPAIPFYRYIKTWRSGLPTFLAHEPPVMKVWGADLTIDEYRSWQGIVGRLDDVDQRGPARTHALTVTEVVALTDDSVAITLAVPAALGADFAFRAGQHVTVAAPGTGVGGRRTYSLCNPPPAGGTVVDHLRIGVKRIVGGVFSSWAATALAPGDQLEVAPPAGRFAPDVTPRATATWVMVAAGSGITPMMSVLGAVLASQPASRVVLLYGNRTAATTMFADELSDLDARVGVHHFHSGGPGAPGVRSGRIDGAAIDAALAAEGLAPGEVDHWLLCGPEGLTTSTLAHLDTLGVPGERVHRELFHVERDPSVGERPDLTATVTVTHQGGQLTYYLPSTGESILDAGLREMPDLPYSCIAGACGTCRARLCSGTVDMDTDAALSPAERDQGFVLTCQAHPISEEVVIDYDAEPALPEVGRRS